MASETNSNGAVTVILPTYNRAAFLPGAFESIAHQSFADWRLVVVDDGSNDNTREVVGSLEASLGRQVLYVRQENRGAYAARNRGLAEATGKYVAFFDSDDLWLPHHLERCVTALEQHADVDWVFGACRLVDRATGQVLEDSTFFPGGRPRPFLSLKTRRAGDLRIITDDAALECQLLHGLYCGLQNSVIRRSLFHEKRFDERSRVVDDEMFVIRRLADGARFGYFLEPHVIYQVHSDNSSASSTGLAVEKSIAIFQEMTAALEQLLADLPLNVSARRALLRRLGREYFWHLGYSGYWQSGRRSEALGVFRRGLSVWPWQLSAWKTYVLAKARVMVGRHTGPD